MLKDTRLDALSGSYVPTVRSIEEALKEMNDSFFNFSFFNIIRIIIVCYLRYDIVGTKVNSLVHINIRLASFSFH